MIMTVLSLGKTPIRAPKQKFYFSFSISEAWHNFFAWVGVRESIVDFLSWSFSLHSEKATFRFLSRLIFK